MIALRGRATSFTWDTSRNPAVIPIDTAPLAGSLLVLALSNTNYTATGVTDSKGNTWTIAKNSGGRMVAWTVQDVGTLTTSDTISVAYGGLAARGVALVDEFTGIAATATVDVSNGATRTAETARTGASVTTTNANDLIYAAFLWATTPVETSFTAGTDYTALGPAPNYVTISNVSAEAEYRVVSSTDTHQPLATGGASVAYYAVTVAFKAAAVAVGTSRVLPYGLGGAVGSSRVLPYILRAARGSSRVLPYTVWKAVGSSRVLPYILRAARGSSRALLYGLTGPVGSSRILRYAVAAGAAVGSSRVLGYTLRRPVGRSRILRYTMGGRVGAGRFLRYKIGRLATIRRVPVADIDRAREPFVEAQALLAGTPRGSIYLTTAGWHGTVFDEERGAVAIVQTGGVLTGLVGSRVRITRTDALGASVYAYVLGESDTDEPISLTRRLFFALGLLSATNISVLVEEVE